MRASVIVITRNRAHSIGEALTALTRQDMKDYEVLVVDSSDAGEREKTMEIAAAHGIRYVSEPRRGQPLARNTGRKSAPGEFIVYTDDDCVPRPDWLGNMLKNFSDPVVWGCTGRVMQHNDKGAANLFEEVAGQDLGTEQRRFTRESIDFNLGILFKNVMKVFAKHMKSGAPAPFGIGHGSSMAFRREALEKLGGFDERYGGESILKYAIEDIELFYRILKSGHAIVYEPSAVVLHKHKLTSEEVFKTRHIYSYTGAALMYEHRRDSLMRFMFCGRLVQLLIKNAQYKLLRKQELAKSFGSDLSGFLAGWKAQREYIRVNGNRKVTAP